MRGRMRIPFLPALTTPSKQTIAFSLRKIRRTLRHHAQPLWTGPRFHVVAAHFGILGFPGEGPGKRIVRNTGGWNVHKVSPPTPVPNPAPTTPTHLPTPAGTSSSEPFSCHHRSTVSTDKGGRPSFHYSVEWVQEQLDKEDGLELIAERLNTVSSRAHKWQRKAMGTQAEVRGGDTRFCPARNPQWRQPPSSGAQLGAPCS
jgi:hypothetical protein